MNSRRYQNLAGNLNAQKIKKEGIDETMYNLEPFKTKPEEFNYQVSTYTVTTIH
jgi:hypothetical protein